MFIIQTKKEKNESTMYYSLSLEGQTEETLSLSMQNMTDAQTTANELHKCTETNFPIC